MSILIHNETRVIIQGITGKEGQKAASAMKDYHTNVVAGVRPGKAGEEVDGVPVFDTLLDSIKGSAETWEMSEEALKKDLISAVYVPPFAAKGALMEAIDAGVPVINTIVERIPIKDTAYCLAAAKERGTQIIGPSSLGFISPGVGRIGVVGGIKVEEVFQPGSVGIISRSGGMTNEISWQMRKVGLGQSTAVHVGGDLLMGTTYADLLRLFQQDDQTKVVAIFGEHGGSYEFEIVEMIERREYTKPLAIYIGGKFANTLPEGMNIGHAGAIVERGKGAAEKEAALKAVGVMIADRYEDLVQLVQEHA